MADSHVLYVTLDAAKAALGISGTDADAVLLMTIEAASRQIDAYCGRRFWTPTAPEVRVFDTPAADLVLDEDLAACDQVINGDGVEVPASDYWLLPANLSPKWAIRLKPTAGTVWQTDPDGNAEQAIEVWGWWGYSASPPAAIRSACLRLTGYHYARRAQSGVSSVSIGDYSVSYAAGSGEASGDMPGNISQDLDAFRRRVVA